MHNTQQDWGRAADAVVVVFRQAVDGFAAVVDKLRDAFGLGSDMPELREASRCHPDHAPLPDRHAHRMADQRSGHRFRSRHHGRAPRWLPDRTGEAGS